MHRRMTLNTGTGFPGGLFALCCTHCPCWWWRLGQPAGWAFKVLSRSAPDLSFRRCCGAM